MNNKDVVLFFGAGAEYVFNFPSGGKYIRESLFKRRTNLYNAVKNIYEKGHEANHIYTVDSIILRNMIRESINDIEETKRTEEQKKIFEYLNSSNKENKSLYKEFVDDLFEDEFDENEQILFIEKLKYEGKIELYFPYLLAKNCDNKSKIINYFWNCYFSILIPYLELAKEYLEENNIIISNDIHNYEYYFSNNGKILKQIIELLKDKRALNYVEKHIKDNSVNYYKSLQKFNDKCSILTTNYTFLSSYYFDDVSYLAGSLSTFENINNCYIKEIEELDSLSSQFPFLYTQAYLKPMISNKYNKIYSNAYDQLVEAKIVLIIGYSLSKNDFHIVTMLREANDERLKKGKEPIIVLEYGEIDKENQDKYKFKYYEFNKCSDKLIEKAEEILKNI